MLCHKSCENDSVIAHSLEEISGERYIQSDLKDEMAAEMKNTEGCPGKSRRHN